MKMVHSYDYVIETNEIQTKEYYLLQPKIGDAEHCTCIYCKNFAELVSTLPQEILDVMFIFNIDPYKDAHLDYFYKASNGKHMYMARYLFVGRIINIPKDKVVTISYHNDEDYITFGISEPTSRIFYTEFRCPQPTLEITVTGFFPWLLEENEE